jgi:hypothetical protein
MLSSGGTEGGITDGFEERDRGRDLARDQLEAWGGGVSAAVGSAGSVATQNRGGGVETCGPRPQCWSTWVEQHSN